MRVLVPAKAGEMSTQIGSTFRIQSAACIHESHDADTPERQEEDWQGGSLKHIGLRVGAPFCPLVDNAAERQGEG